MSSNDRTGSNFRTLTVGALAVAAILIAGRLPRLVTELEARATGRVLEAAGQLSDAVQLRELAGVPSGQGRGGAARRAELEGSVFSATSASEASAAFLQYITGLLEYSGAHLASATPETLARSQGTPTPIRLNVVFTASTEALFDFLKEAEGGVPVVRVREGRITPVQEGAVSSQDVLRIELELEAIMRLSGRFP